MNMNQSNAVSIHDTSKARELTVTAMFVAIVLIMAFTPIGIIDLPLIKATILHVPVIIGAILLGPKKGAFLGFLFGLTSFIKNSMAPSVLSFAFTPAVPVPGTGSGSPLAIVICFLPRILVGVTPWLLYRALVPVINRFSSKTGKTGLRGILLAAAGALGAFTNTALVMGMIYVFFNAAYAAVNGISSQEVLKVILGVVTANGIPEAIVAAVMVPVICIALMKTRMFRQAAYEK